MKKYHPYNLCVLAIFMITYPAISQEYLRSGGFGSTDSEQIEGSTLDPSGDIILCGTFNRSMDIDISKENQFILTPVSKVEVYVAKYDPKGNFKWAFNLDGKRGDFHYVRDVATDSDGNIYITGHSNGWIDFDPSEGKDSLWTGDNMLYLAKYDPDGNYLWAHVFGTDQYNGQVIGWSLATDKNDGSVYMAGNINDSIDFDPSEGTAPLKSDRYFEMFLAKYDKDGKYLWAKLFSGPKIQTRSTPLALESDKSGNVYLSGYFVGIYDMDPSEGDHPIENETTRDDGFIASYDKDGNYLWSGTLSSDQQVLVRSLVLHNDSLYVVGQFSDTADFNPGGDGFLVPNYEHEYSGFMAVYDKQGDFIDAIAFPGDSMEYQISNTEVHDIAIDPYGSRYLLGSFYGSFDVDPSEDTLTLYADRQYAIFLAKYDSKNQLQWASSMGGNEQERGKELELTKHGEVLAMGIYDGTFDVDPGETEILLYNNGGHDIYMDWFFGFIPVSIDETMKQPGCEIRYAPNPTRDQLNIESSQPLGQVTIYSVTGNLMYAKEAADQFIQIDMGTFPAGYYIIRVSDHNRQNTFGIVKCD